SVTKGAAAPGGATGTWTKLVGGWAAKNGPTTATRTTAPVSARPTWARRTRSRARSTAARARAGTATGGVGTGWATVAVIGRPSAAWGWWRGSPGRRSG